MKKFFAIPLLILYITAVSGMMVQLHFCGDKLASWNLNNKQNSCCCESTSADVGGIRIAGPDNCCFDQVITLKIDQDQDKTGNIMPDFSSLFSITTLPGFNIPGFIFFSDQVNIGTCYAHGPPGIWQNIPLYKLHSRFTYYG